MNSMGNQGTAMQGEYKSETMPDPQKDHGKTGRQLTGGLGLAKLGEETLVAKLKRGNTKWMEVECF